MGRVAIVDDYEDALQLFKALLGDGCQEFLTFRSGESFLNQFHPGSFDLILLDLAMPGMGEFEIFQRIQRVDKNVPSSLLRHGHSLKSARKHCVLDSVITL